MRFFDAGSEAHGFIAVGQIATGVIALGQFATGVIAIGQVARGVVAIGQGAIGVVAVGMGSAGLAVSVGMLGVGGRGLGLVLPLTPTLGPAPALPEIAEPAALALGGGSGWVRGTVIPDPLHLELPGQEAVRLDAKWRHAAAAFAASGPRAVLAKVRFWGQGLVAEDLLAIPRSRLRAPGWWLVWASQCVGLVVLAGVVWVVALIPILGVFGYTLKAPWSALF